MEFHFSLAVSIRFRWRLAGKKFWEVVKKEYKECFNPLSLETGWKGSGKHQRLQICDRFNPLSLETGWKEMGYNLLLKQLMRFNPLSLETGWKAVTGTEVDGSITKFQSAFAGDWLERRTT